LRNSSAAGLSLIWQASATHHSARSRKYAAVMQMFPHADTIEPQLSRLNSSQGHFPPSGTAPYLSHTDSFFIRELNVSAEVEHPDRTSGIR
jgi:hypothetical protein